MVRADHQQVVVPAHRVLRGHAHAGLGVAAREVGELLAGGRGVGGLEPVDGRSDVVRDHPVRLDEGERGLRVVLVLLGAVRQSHGHELGGDLVLAQLLHGQLCEPPRERGVHAAADAQHEAPGVRRPEVVAQEVDAPRRLRLRVDPRGHPELGDDLCLQFTHAAMLATACFRGVTDPRPTTPLGRLGESLTVTPHLARMAGAHHVRHLSCQQRVSVPGRMRWRTVTRACEAGHSGVVRCWPHD